MMKNKFEKWTPLHQAIWETHSQALRALRKAEIITTEERDAIETIISLSADKFR